VLVVWLTALFRKASAAVAGKRWTVAMLWQGAAVEAGQVLCYLLSLLQKMLCKYIEAFLPQ